MKVRFLLKIPLWIRILNKILRWKIENLRGWYSPYTGVCIILSKFGEDPLFYELFGEYLTLDYNIIRSITHESLHAVATSHLIRHPRLLDGFNRQQIIKGNEWVVEKLMNGR